jgi:hypothetical protein
MFPELETVDELTPTMTPPENDCAAAVATGSSGARRMRRPRQIGRITGDLQV